MNIALAASPRLSSLTVADLLPGDCFRLAIAAPAALVLTSTSQDGAPGCLDVIETRPREHVALDIGTGDLMRIAANVAVIRLEPFAGEVQLMDASGVMAATAAGPISGIILP